MALNGQITCIGRSRVSGELFDRSRAFRLLQSVAKVGDDRASLDSFTSEVGATDDEAEIEETMSFDRRPTLSKFSLSVL